MASLHPALRLHKIYHSTENRQVQIFHCCMLKMNMTEDTYSWICKSKLRTVTKPPHFTTVVKIWLAFWEHSWKILIFKAVSLSKQTECSHSFSNIYPTRSNVTQFIWSGNCSTCFGWYLHPSSGAHTTVSTASGVCHTVTAICRYRRSVGTGLSALWVAYATHLLTYLLHGAESFLRS